MDIKKPIDKQNNLFVRIFIAMGFIAVMCLLVSQQTGSFQLFLGIITILGVYLIIWGE